MLKKSITYKNLFTGEEVTEEHYFHISKADLLEMELALHNVEYTAKDGQTYPGMRGKLQRIVDAEDGQGIMDEIKDWIHRSYGIKDGSRFRKTKEIWEDFAATEAYSQLFFDLCTDAEAAGAFLTSVVPDNLDQIAAEIQARMDAQNAATSEAPAADPETPVKPTGDPTARWLTADDPTGLTSAVTPQVLTTEQVIAMDSDELKSGLATGKYKLS